MVNFGVWFAVSCKVLGTFVATEILRYLPIGYAYLMAFLMTILLLVLTGVIYV